MSGTKSILAFAGSTRSGSLNKKALGIAAEAARDSGAEVTVIDLRDYPLPIYDGDLEESEGVPDNALRLKRLFKANRGLLIATPGIQHFDQRRIEEHHRLGNPSRTG